MQDASLFQPDVLSLFRTLPGAFLIVAPDVPRFTVIAATAGFLQIVEVPEDNLLQRSIYELYGAQPQTFLDQLSASLHQLVQYKNEHRLSLQIGNLVFHLHLQPVFGSDGKVRYIVHTLEKEGNPKKQKLDEEYHRLKEQAHRNERTNEAITDILYSMHLDSRKVTYINHPFEEKLGYTREEIGKMEDPLFNMMYPDDITAVLDHIEDMRGVKDGDFLEVEYRLRHADGSLRWFRDRNTVFKRDEKGRVLEKIGIAQDITVHKAAETALKESNINLRYANDKLQQFASIASHDLQEPLRKIKLYSTRLVQRFAEALPAEGKEVVGKIKNAAERMSHLISDVLEYSKIAYGAKDLEPTDLNAVLNYVMGDLSAQMEESGGEIRQPAALPTLEVIPVQIRHLFYNLLTNALKFRREGVKPVITITARALPAGEVRQYPQLRENFSYAEICVADNGIGFEQEFAEQIFQLFERLHTDEEFEGTGIGLALCKKVVENHYGHIVARSEEGKGASFYVFLPISQQEA